MRKDSHTAAPATSPAAPSSAKMPAPTMAPTPMNAACRTDRYWSVGRAWVMSTTSPSPPAEVTHGGSDRLRRQRLCERAGGGHDLPFGLLGMRAEDSVRPRQHHNHHRPDGELGWSARVRGLTLVPAVPATISGMS